jgi:site-specific DNA-methyltransferase (adenine-specific)
VFYKHLPTYNPQKTKGKPYSTKGGMRKNIIKTLEDKEKLGGDLTRRCASFRAETINNGDRFPLTVLNYKKDSDSLHPTQKPIALLEYLIKTYTNENETVLDFTMGSGSTGVACVNTKRNFIGIEKDDNYFKIAEDRINKAKESIFDL